MNDEVELYHEGVQVGFAKIMRNSLYGTTRSFDPKTSKINFTKYGELKWKGSPESWQDNQELLTRFKNSYSNATVMILPASEENWMLDGIISIEFYNVADEAEFIVKES